jgi:transcriptional regulator with XRE-family HTH domain
MLKEKSEILPTTEMIRSGRNFLGILNDLKRRPEDAAKELGLPVAEINDIIAGKKPLSSDLVKKAVSIWPINEREFYIIKDDCPKGVKIMTSVESKHTSRVMERAGKPYYEYRDTVMSAVAPFRPEWIMELCYVDNDDPDNPSVQWNNGHFMHQFTYFIGEVNFYYRLPGGKKQVAVMNTGDSMYITPFVAHTFTTRKGAKENGLILALTYGGKLTGDIQQELSSLSTSLGSQFALDFSSRESAISSLIAFNRQNSNLTINELANRTEISSIKLEEYESGKVMPDENHLRLIAKALGISLRDLLANDVIEPKVVVKHYSEGRRWLYPEDTHCYEFVELASTTALPYSKAFEIIVRNSNEQELDLKVGLHQYVYNVGDSAIQINWELDEKKYNETINPGDSLYIKPFVPHNFRGNGKLLVLRIGSKVVGDSQRELSIVGKDNATRAISETMQWFDPKGKN